ncbi:GNAT family N-acetyltransferase [Ascidiaceihabitans sp.]|nr:GNAT family N-acetyltransferase [Ascidiaceihabitans sp.]
MSGKITVIAAESEVHFEAARYLCRDWVNWQLKVFPEKKDIILSVFDPIEYAKTLENLPSIHARPKGAIILASLDGDYVGCVMYQEMAPKLAEVKRLFVAESGRGHGVGHILLTEMFRHMKNDGYERTQFSSARFLTHARDLYEKVGFEEIPLPQDIPDELAETVYFMEKALNVTQNQSSTLTDNAVWDGIFGKRN